jgi:tRNA G18 (ribose-2'-O)-methylase SpoU
MSILITDLEDPRVAPYRALKDRELARQSDLFIAEGEHVVRRLLDSRFETKSVLLAERKLSAVEPFVPTGVAIYRVANQLIHDIVGYRFHSGVIAAGKRKPLLAVEELMINATANERTTLVICPETNNTENLGMLIRLAAGFGADGIILGENSCDPLYRQCIRVSMGTVFHLPIARSSNIRADLLKLKAEWNVQLAATVLDNDAEPIDAANRADRFALLFGSEPQGLPPDIINLCDRKITIPMFHGTDSLNVATAAAVFLYHFTRRTP